VRPLIIVWPYALVFWAVFLWVFYPEFRIVSRRDERSATAQDAGSRRVIFLGQGVGLLVGLNAPFIWPSAALPFPGLCFWMGIAALIGGSLLRRHCWRMLGDSFTGAVIVNERQAVVERGAYRYVRHPSYSAGVLIFFGIGLATGNWVSTLVIVGAGAATYAYRVSVEERVLLATLGERYAAYMRRTKRFVPGVF
jgi:protein-S-isoprenylcysteine O-methyltransferase Ste14